MQIDWTSIILGVVALAYGIYTFVQRSRNPDTFGKLVAMKKIFGDNAGDIIHLVAYGILPIVLSGLMFMKAFGIQS
jgi:hypothetical protein